MLPPLTGCMQRSGDEGSPAIKVFSALGICLAAIFLVFYHSRENGGKKIDKVPARMSSLYNMI